MENEQLEQLLNKAMQCRRMYGLAIEDGTACLSGDKIQSFYEGRLDDPQRVAAIEHLAQCIHCCDDLKMYADLVAQ
jgi:hypothetical protein